MSSLLPTPIPFYVDTCIKIIMDNVFLPNAIDILSCRTNDFTLGSAINGEEIDRT